MQACEPGGFVLSILWYQKFGEFVYYDCMENEFLHWVCVWVSFYDMWNYVMEYVHSVDHKFIFAFQNILGH